MSTTPRSAATRGFRALIGEDRWRALTARGRPRPWPANSLLLGQGDRESRLYALESGRVRVVYTGAEGTETFIAIRGPGDLIGEYAQRDAGERTASVWTLESCEVTALAFGVFGSFIKEARLENELQRYVMAKTRQNPQRIHWALHRSMEQRLAQFLLEVVDAGVGPTASQIHLSQKQIGDALGVTRPWVNRALKKWRVEGVIRTRPDPITVLDVAALTRRALRDPTCSTSPPEK